MHGDKIWNTEEVSALQQVHQNEDLTNNKNLEMISGEKERQDQLAIVLVRDQGPKVMMKVQRNNQRKRRPEKNRDQEADKNEENHQNQ